MTPLWWVVASYRFCVDWRAHHLLVTGVGPRWVGDVFVSIRDGWLDLVESTTHPSHDRPVKSSQPCVHGAGHTDSDSGRTSRSLGTICSHLRSVSDCRFQHRVEACLPCCLYCPT